MNNEESKLKEVKIDLKEGEKPLSETKGSLALSEKVASLEAGMAKLKAESAAKIDLLKEKLILLRAKNVELLAKVKELSPMEYIKEKYAAIKATLQRNKDEPAPAEKMIVCYECGGQIGYLRGYVYHDETGFLVIEDAEFVDYSPNSEPVCIAQIGRCILDVHHVVMWF